MKKLLPGSFFLLLTTLVFVSCKKDKGKDYAEVIKDKVWVGTFKYPAKTDQYYCIQFRADSSLMWSEFYEDYQGYWKLNGNQLSIFSNVQAVATISDDNKLINIINDSTTSYNYPTLNSGELNTHSGIALDNTVWKGSQSGLPGELVFSFKPGSTVEAKYGVVVLYNGSYIRAGAGIRFGENGLGFGVIMPGGNEIKGRYVGATISPWQVTKQ